MGLCGEDGAGVIENSTATHPDQRRRTGAYRVRAIEALGVKWVMINDTMPDNLKVTMVL